KVVAGDVGLVADGHEGREADPQLSRVVQDHHAQGPALREHAHVAGSGEGGGEGRVEADGGIGVDHAHAVGADEAEARRTRRLARRAAPSVPGVREAPTTATLRGCRSARTLSADARQARSSLARTTSLVASMGNQAWTTPPPEGSCTRKPRLARTSSIFVFPTR